jgi:tRNA pseudouridine38-40 synthase
VANVCMVLEYDGTEFHGWQAQPGGQRTVQAEVERALATVTGESPRLVAAGRTDAGAHSLGQTVSFELSRELQPERLRQSLNGVLPRDIAVVSAAPAPDGFHARFSASRRRYRYLVENRSARAAVLRDRAWHVRQTLDIRAMRAAARDLVGRRDLGAFGHDPAGRNDVRNLEEIRIRRLKGVAEGHVIAFELTADAFLYGMVRRIVGFLVEVGMGRREAGDAARLLSGEGTSPRVAPAHGLYQLAVEYPAAVMAA